MSRSIIAVLLSLAVLGLSGCQGERFKTSSSVEQYACVVELSFRAGIGESHASVDKVQHHVA
jgi:hypothetical protein